MNRQKMSESIINVDGFCERRKIEAARVPCAVPLSRRGAAGHMFERVVNFNWL